MYLKIFKLYDETSYSATVFPAGEMKIGAENWGEKESYEPTDRIPREVLEYFLEHSKHFVEYCSTQKGFV